MACSPAVEVCVVPNGVVARGSKPYRLFFSNLAHRPRSKGHVLVVDREG